MAEPNTTSAARSASTGAQPDPLIGRVINERFRIISMLAKGGMGKVYKAEQLPLGRLCALKVLNPNYAGDNDPEFHKRFFLEAATAAKLSHPNTVKVFDYGRSDDEVFFMAMELLEGRTLHRAIRETAPLDPRRVCHITKQIARSLREAHGLGVIHRDLKPANIFLIKNDEEEDYVKVLDFGLVKNVEEDGGEGGGLTQTGLFMGSPKYMAPEQIRGERVTVCTDIYALGVVMFEMLTGKVPFDRAGSSVNTLMAHVNDPVPSMRDTAPSAIIPAPVEDLVLRCLNKRAEDRYSSMEELLTALKRASALAFGDGAMPMTAEYSTTGSLTTGRGGDSLLPDPTATGSLRGMRTNSVPAPPISNDPTNTPPGTVVPAVKTGSGSRTGIMVGIVAVVLLGSGAAVMLSRKTPPPVKAAADNIGQVTTPNGSQTPQTPQTASTDPSPLAVVLKSEPAEAQVFDGDVLLGKTPLNITWTGDQADPKQRHRFRFKLVDHKDMVVELAPENGKIEYTATLELPVAATVASASATTADAGATGSTTATNPPATNPGGTGRPTGVRPTGVRPTGGRPTGVRPTGTTTRPGGHTDPDLPTGFRPPDDNW